MFLAALYFLLTFGDLRRSNANTVENFNIIQRALRERRNVLGENSYDCYADGGICVLEYHNGELLTFREEADCPSGDCGESILQRKKREDACLEASEDLDLCRRSTDGPLCKRELAKMEESSCGDILLERRTREKRDACVTMVKRADQLCGGSTKRALSDSCALVLRSIEEMECYDDEVVLEKRGKVLTCDAGWALNDGNCFKYLSGPFTFEKAEKQCETAIKGGRLATLERMVAANDNDREFFRNLIKSSGAKDVIDKVLGEMPDKFGGKDWKDVIEYYDNWAWIGVKMSDEKYRWVNPGQKDETKWNPVKTGHGDWHRGQPSNTNKMDIDNGHCVVYFQFERTKADNHGNTKLGDTGAWWNVNCRFELPFLCEVKAK